MKLKIIILRSELTHNLCLFLYKVCHKLENHYIHLGIKADKVIAERKRIVQLREYTEDEMAATLEDLKQDFIVEDKE